MSSLKNAIIALCQANSGKFPVVCLENGQAVQTVDRWPVAVKANPNVIVVNGLARNRSESGCLYVVFENNGQLCIDLAKPCSVKLGKAQKDGLANYMTKQELGLTKAKAAKVVANDPFGNGQVSQPAMPVKAAAFTKVQAPKTRSKAKTSAQPVDRTTELATALMGVLKNYL